MKVSKKKSTLLWVAMICVGSLSLELKAKSVDINGAAIFRSKQVRRGALIWDDPIMIAGPSFRFFNVIDFRGGGGISLFKQTGFHEFRLGWSFFDDSKPRGPVLKLGSSEETHINQRRTTSEAFISYTFRYKWWFSFVSELYKDLDEHKGLYGSLEFSGAIFPYVRLGSKIGLGDREHNMYMYGRSGAGGLAHHDIFLSSFIAGILPGSGNLILKLEQNKVSKQANQEAFFIRGDDTQYVSTVMGLWTWY